MLRERAASPENNELRPQWRKRWGLPPKPSAELVYPREDVLGVYQQPPDPQRPVVCRDETSRQLIGEGRDPLSAQPGAVARFDSVDGRNGVAHLFVAFEPEVFAPDEAKRLADRLEIHDTPQHGSWLNMAEIELSVLTRDLPARIGDRAALEQHLAVWQQRRNRSRRQANWQFTTTEARTKLRKLYPTVEN